MVCKSGTVGAPRVHRPGPSHDRIDQRIRDLTRSRMGYFSRSQTRRCLNVPPTDRVASQGEAQPPGANYTVIVGQSARLKCDCDVAKPRAHVSLQLRSKHLLNLCLIVGVLEIVGGSLVADHDLDGLRLSS